MEESAAERAGRPGIVDPPAKPAQPRIETVKVAGGSDNVVVTPHAGPASVRNQVGQLCWPGQTLGIGGKLIAGRAVACDR